MDAEVVTVGPACAAAQGRDVAVGVLDRLEDAVDAVQARGIDGLDDGQLVAELDVLEMVGRRVQARAARLTAAISHRHTVRARQANGGDERGALRPPATRSVSSRSGSARTLVM